ncbi:unnamed protein product [Dibothriocephalus latus]|uniref:Uncharacterized protein n=1 Tax=Dibothriocephalus latus TaxID=60516 RepID=A0A3P6QDS7_DIBLA|nr:unnamed protein product [Dibothriocephalus latus]
MTSTDTFKTSNRPTSLSTTVSTFGQRPYGLDGTSRHFSETYDTSTMPRFPESIILGGQSRELPVLSFESEHFGHNRPQTPDATLVGQPQICGTAALDPVPFNSERQTLPRSVEALTIDRRALR